MVKKDLGWFNPEVVGNLVQYFKGMEPQCFMSICYLVCRYAGEDGKFRIMQKDVVKHSGLTRKSVGSFISLMLSMKLLDRVKTGRTYDYFFYDGNIVASSIILGLHQGIAQYLRRVLGNRPIFSATESDIIKAKKLSGKFDKEV